MGAERSVVHRHSLEGRNEQGHAGWPLAGKAADEWGSWWSPCQPPGLFNGCQVRLLPFLTLQALWLVNTILQAPYTRQCFLFFSPKRGERTSLTLQPVCLSMCSEFWEETSSLPMGTQNGVMPFAFVQRTGSGWHCFAETHGRSATGKGRSQ